MLREQLAGNDDSADEDSAGSDLQKALIKPVQFRLRGSDDDDSGRTCRFPRDQFTPGLRRIRSTRNAIIIFRNGHCGSGRHAHQGGSRGRVIEVELKAAMETQIVIQAEDGRKMLYAHNNQNFVQAGDLGFSRRRNRRSSGRLDEQQGPRTF